MTAAGALAAINPDPSTGLDRLPPGSGTARGKAGNIAKMLLGLSLAEKLRGLPSPPVLRNLHHLPPQPPNGTAAPAPQESPTYNSRQCRSGPAVLHTVGPVRSTPQ